MTDEQRKISNKYLVYRFFANLWFVEAVWLYFYRLYITDQQIGILDGMAFAIGLLAEVPSGALADKFGRGKIVKLGQILAGCGLLLQAFGSSFMPFFVGQAVMMIGVSLVSGADEALFFDKLKFEKGTRHWRRLITRATQVSLVAIFIAVIAGGWLHTLNPRIPWVLNGIAFIVSAVIIWRLTDNKRHSKQGTFAAGFRGYIDEIRIGFRQFRLPKLWLYVPIILTVQGLFYATEWGLLRLLLLDRFHFSPFWGSVALATISIIAVVVLGIMHKHAEKLSEKWVLSIITLGAMVSMIVSLWDIGAFGYLVILALFLGGHSLTPFMSEILNYHAPEQQRATVLSVASFLRTLPYVILAPLLGFLSTQNQLHQFFIGWTIAMGFGLAYYLLQRKKDILISLDGES